MAVQTHAAITQGYQSKLQAYNDALAQAKAAAGVVIAGHNPVFNAEIIARELRRQCLTLVTGQQFDAFGALELTADGYAQPNLWETAAQMPYVRFFEQAFEWNTSCTSSTRTSGVGNTHGRSTYCSMTLIRHLPISFVPAPCALSSRFDLALRRLSCTISRRERSGTGGPPPDISSSLYVSIVKEVQEATGAPGDEVPVGDPWQVHLPTTLVQLRPNDDLPEWKKVGEDWQPAN